MNSILYYKSDGHILLFSCPLLFYTFVYFVYFLIVYPEKLFSEFEDRALPNVAPLAMYRNRLVEDCAKICLYDLNFTCRSFEYNVVQQSCRFYDQTRADTGGLSIMTGYNHYELKSQSQSRFNFFYFNYF